MLKNPLHQSYSSGKAAGSLTSPMKLHLRPGERQPGAAESSWTQLQNDYQDNEMNLTGPGWACGAEERWSLQLRLSEGVRGAVLSRLFLTGSFRQPQPGVQGRGGNRDVGLERQRP